MAARAAAGGKIPGLFLLIAMLLLLASGARAFHLVRRW